ncbi:hypothetical protein [Photobacterium sanguinicancri]|uniref:hypothetical protein n=1 Tax=Photobacterium sanguinicancri TaxID=875932 RepID=UPI0021C3D0A3|nr:hypothetical protein [Photobacterium sanguinicancri]
MKIAIYGVSRSGKDYLIDRVVNHLNLNSDIKACHIEGSKTLNSIAFETYGRSFKSLCESDKVALRKKFVDIVNQKEKEYQLVIVDGHYSFINENSYNVVFTDEDKNTYDHFFYLDTPSHMIIKFARNSGGEKRNLDITEEQVFNWKLYEKDELQKVCSLLDKELVILDEDAQSCVDFIESWVKGFDEKYSYNKMANNILDGLTNELSQVNEVLLLDCDKTVSTNDVTYDFCQELDIDSYALKKIFRNDRYTSYQFYKVWCLYKSKEAPLIVSASEISLERANLSNDILGLIKNRRDALVIGITSGVYQIWDLISKKHDLFNVLIGNTCSNSLDYYVTPLLKRSIVLELQKRKKNVTAIGDSIIDIPMLESADFGYIVAHEKVNRVVEKYLVQEKSTQIKQIFRSEFGYSLSNVSELEVA